MTLIEKIKDKYNYVLFLLAINRHTKVKEQEERKRYGSALERFIADLMRKE